MNQTLNVFEHRVAGALGRIGERTGQDWLIYSPVRMHLFHRMAKGDAPGVAASITTVFPDAKLLADVGCGSGAFAAAINAAGRIVVGCERSRLGLLMAQAQGVDARPFDLNDPPPVWATGFDLAYCFEVAEHIPPDLGDRLVEFLCRTSKTVVFTAAHPGQGGSGHINEQPPSYWQERFARHGYKRDDDRAAALVAEMKTQGVWAPWLLDNMMVYAGR